MEVAFMYTKKRAEFGHHCTFTDIEAKVLESVPSTAEYEGDYIVRNPSIMEVDTTPAMAEHEVNTERVVHKNAGMRHVQGGWPENVDGTEADQVDRYLKKFNKETKFKSSVQAMGAIVDTSVKQNNTIDIYEEYFAGAVAEHASEKATAKGLAVFRDPNAVKRSATNINWHPEGSRIAVAYSVLNFQDDRIMSQRLPMKSYVWDITNPNTPDAELVPSSPLVCLRFNPKLTDTLVGGCYNGLISFFDLRTPGGPTEESVIENSHHDPVYDVFWLSSKTNTMCASVSTDGQMLWWDVRRLGEPTDRLSLEDGTRILGGSSMEYNSEAGPTKYLVGTEQGIVLSINMRKKSKASDCCVPLDMGSGKHHGPIYSIQRNPTHTKFFLTVGDWTARVWAEDGKTPIMTTKYSLSYLTAGCWSPTRPGVFYTARMDGVVDIWDYYYRQNAVALSHKVGDQALSSIAVQGSTQSGGGRLVAVGDVNGNVSLLEVCESLAVPQANEKTAIGAMFERESKREKNLEKRAIELSRRAKVTDGGEGKDERKADSKDEKMEEILRKVDAEFLAMIKDAEEEEAKDTASASMARAAAGGSGDS